MTWTFDNSDALEWLKKMPNASIDALVTDPPYASGGLFRSDRVQGSANQKYINGAFPEFLGENKDQWSYLTWSYMWMAETFRVLKQGAPFIIFIDWRQLVVLHTALQVSGFVLRGIAVWDKTQGIRPQKGKFRQQAEFMLWGSKGTWSGHFDGVLPGVITCSPARGGRFHACGKPLELMETLMQLVAPDGAVLDPFAGSASTGVAALNSGRNFFGCEQDEAYWSVGFNRLREASQNA